MQGNFDKNEENLQQQVNKLESVELAKESDRKYYRERLKKVVSDLNSSDFGNLAFNNTLNAMGAYASQAIDDVVLTAHAGTQAGKKIDLEYQAQKSKDPLSVSETNYQFSKKDYNKWLQDDRAGVVFRGNSNYVPFVDMDKVVNDYVSKMKPNTTVKNVMEQYWIYNEKGERVLDNDIKAGIDSLIAGNPNYKKQLEVNGWAQYQSYDDKSFMEYAKKRTAELYANYDNSHKEYLEHSTGKKLLAANPEEAQYYSKQAEYSKNQKEKYGNMFNTLNGAQFKDYNQFSSFRAAMETDLSTEDFKAKTAQALSYNNVTSKDVKINELPFKLADQQRENAKFDWEKKMDIEKLKMDEKKMQLDVFKATGKDLTSQQAAEYFGLPEALVNPDVTAKTSSEMEVPTADEFKQQRKQERENLGADLVSIRESIIKDYNSTSEGKANPISDEEADAFIKGQGLGSLSKGELLKTIKSKITTSYASSPTLKTRFKTLYDKSVEYNRYVAAETELISTNKEKTSAIFNPSTEIDKLKLNVNASDNAILTNISRNITFAPLAFKSKKEENLNLAIEQANKISNPKVRSEVLNILNNQKQAVGGNMGNKYQDPMSIYLKNGIMPSTTTNFETTDKNIVSLSTQFLKEGDKETVLKMFAEKDKDGNETGKTVIPSNAMVKQVNDKYYLSIGENQYPIEEAAMMNNASMKRYVDVTRQTKIQNTEKVKKSLAYASNYEKEDGDYMLDVWNGAKGGNTYKVDLKKINSTTAQMVLVVTDKNKKETIIPYNDSNLSGDMKIYPLDSEESVMKNADLSVMVDAKLADIKKYVNINFEK
jgi:hypothetical protein